MKESKITGGTNISPLISSVILASVRLSIDKRKLLSTGIEKTISVPKKILKNSVNMFNISGLIKNKEKQQVKPKAKTVSKSKAKTVSKPKAKTVSKPKAKTVSKSKTKMNGGGSKEFFE